MQDDRRSRGRSTDSPEKEWERRALAITAPPTDPDPAEAPRPSWPIRILAGIAHLWRRPWWLVALIIALSGSVAISSYLHDDPRPLLLGQTSDGHRLMERTCSSCHVPWGRPDAARCAACHQAELAKDHHPAAKFANVARWGDLLERFDPRNCVTCHREHRPAEMGFTAEPTICSECHGDIAEIAPDHRDLPFDGCLGCHNYHDESAIAPTEVTRRHGEPDTHPPAEWLAPSSTRLPPASAPAPDAPTAILRAAGAAVTAWRASAHATAGVNCSTCHTLHTPSNGAAQPGPTEGDWLARPDEHSCAACHAPEVDTYHRGRHGMRAAANAGPTVSAAGAPLAVRDPDVRLPMQADAPEHQSCAACHGVHGLDLERAQVAACLSCHDDEHSRNYESSPHGRARAAGRSDVPTCASCHLVGHRETDPTAGVERRVTNHNNSFTMRPPERMLGDVCSKCHSLNLAWSALRSPAAVQKNFTWHPPDPEVERYLKMVDDRTRARRAGKNGEKEDRR